MQRAPAVVIVATLGLGACNPFAPPPDANRYPWLLGPSLPEPRQDSGVTAVGQRLVVVGGFDRSEAVGLHLTPSVLLFDPNAPNGGVWSALPDAPVAWARPNVGGIGSTLYLLGGLEGPGLVPRGAAWAFDTVLPGATWRPLAPIPAGLERGGAAVVVSPPLIFLLGGETNTSAVATNLVYNSATDTWAQLPDLPAPRTRAAATRELDGTLIIAGGLASLDSSQPYDDVWELPPGASAWVRRESRMEVARGGCAYGIVLGQLVCAGGEANGAALTITQSYDPHTDRWTRLADMPEPRARTRGATVSGRLYVPGGSPGVTIDPTSTLYVLAFLDSLAPTQ